MKTTFLSFALAAALVFAGGNQVMAQHGHGGGHAGAVHAGGAHAGSGHVAAYGAYHGGYAHYGNHNHGYGYGPYLGFALGYALGGSGYGYAPAYGYAYPSYGYAVPSYYGVEPSAYAAPAYATPAYAAPASAQQGVLMNVVVPKADAEVFINDTATSSTGTERQFESPALDPGQSYHYTIRAQWMDNGKRVEQKREVPVKAGQTVTVDFSKPAREVVTPPQVK